MEEIWKTVEGFENYQVSNKGRIRNLNYGNLGYCKILKQGNNESGYALIQLHKNGKRYQRKMHRLIAKEFIPNPNNYPAIHHKNEIKDDNRVENLEWCTQKQNMEHSFGKKIVGTNIETGEKIYFNSVSSTKEAGFEFRAVSACCNNRRKTHKGYTWRFY